AEESKSKRNRYTELSEDIGETKASAREEKASARAEKASAREKKASARQKAANPSSKQSARADSANPEKRGDSRRRKKSTGRVPTQKGQSGREKAKSGREKAGSGRSSAKQAVAAEVQSLRTLLDRTEKERRFYRHLTVGMVVFLMLLMSLLFVKLMSGDSDDEQDKTDVVKNSAKNNSGRRPAAMVLNLPKNGLENAKRLDGDVFANAILPILKTKCAACHGPSHSKSKFRFDPNNEKQALAMAASYVLPGRPDRSFLLQKPLPKSEGGEIHKGGAVFKTDSEDFRAIHGWINDVKTPGQDNNPETPDMGNSELAP
ncbi:MAG: hypothetical protein P1V97_37520, partial [Planctomycetota bacterium]|nr:hypothetical protein [Planctomycetota bacterium]